MLNLKMRGVFAGCTVAITLFAALPQGEAAGTCCGPAPAAISYARPYAAGRITWLPSYGVSSTGNPLVPGSRGYAVYRPVTAFLPATACHSCASPASPYSTCLTTYQSKYKPGQPIRNVFRILLPPYGPRLQTVCYTPQTSFSPISSVSFSPTSCGSCSPVVGTSYYATTCDTCASCPSGVAAPATTPSYNGSSSYPSSPPSTYKQGQGSEQEPEQHLKPAPDASMGPAKINMPKLVDPETRTALAPLRQAVRYRPVSLAGSAASAVGSVDVGGWRASRD